MAEEYPKLASDLRALATPAGQLKHADGRECREDAVAQKPETAPGDPTVWDRCRQMRLKGPTGATRCRGIGTAEGGDP